MLSDSTAHPPVHLSGFVNGTEYRVTVTSVLTNGLEGKRSAALVVVPGVFGLQVEGDREVTRNPLVQLALVAPVGARGLQVANGPALDSAPTQPFSTSIVWELTPGDGDKVVFARIIDAEGNFSVPVSDGIRLDTRADIASLTFQPTQAGPGDQLNFRLDAGEPHGSARITLGTGGTRLDLRDDGLSGDTAADDGVYALTYTVPLNLALVDALVTGDFTDQAGNAAPSFLAPIRLTVLNDPPAVTLAPIVSPAPGELYLSWTEVSDAGRFSAYRLFRADAPGVDTSLTRVEVREITDRNTTTFTDTGLDPNATYYYIVDVVDPNGQHDLEQRGGGLAGTRPAARSGVAEHALDRVGDVGLPLVQSLSIADICPVPGTSGRAGRAGNRPPTPPPHDAHRRRDHHLRGPHGAGAGDDLLLPGGRGGRVWHRLAEQCRAHDHPGRAAGRGDAKQSHVDRRNGGAPLLGPHRHP